MNYDAEMFETIHRNHEKQDVVEAEEYELDPWEQQDERRQYGSPALGLIFRWLLAGGFAAAIQANLIDPMLGGILTLACGLWGGAYWIWRRRCDA